MGDFQASIESIRQAASWMDSHAVRTATDLKDTIDYLNTYAAQSDWSDVPSCIAFGKSYNAAVEAYQTVVGDLLEDAGKMRDALNKVADDYENADESARAQMEARLLAITDKPFFTDSAGDGAYADRRDVLTSDNPQQAAPNDADTGGSGDGDGSGNGGTPAPTRTGGGRVVAR